MAPSTALSPSAEKVDRVLRSHGLDHRVVELDASTRTAPEAARSIGCDVRQIVKSLVFRGARSGRPVLVLVSGSHRADEPWLERHIGEPLEQADPEFVRTRSGFAIGGVPPIGHPEPFATFIDYDLLECPEVWAAAGTPNALCRLTSLELLEVTRGRAVPVTSLSSAEPSSGRWMTFDCYGTLVDWRTGLLAALDRVLPTSNSLGPGSKERFFRTFLVEEQRLESGPYLPYRDVMASALCAAAAIEGLSLSRASADSIVGSIPEWPLFPDTGEALRELADRGVRLAVLSNIDRDLLEQTLSRRRLRITTFVTAQDVGSYKPSPAHWIRFLKQTGLDPERVWHVAGSYEYDITTACALGFRTAFVARYGGSGEGGCSDIEVTDLAEFARRLALPPERAAPSGTAEREPQDRQA